MSIVGPRPHAVRITNSIQPEGFMLRHKVKPHYWLGADNGRRGETDTLEKMEKRVEFDLSTSERLV